MTFHPDLHNLVHVLITPLDLEKDSLQIHDAIAPGVIDYALDIRQVGALPVDGRADLLIEHRGHGESVSDIRLRASYKGAFEVLCARCVEPVATPLSGDFDLIFRPQDADAESGERAITVDETEIGSPAVALLGAVTLSTCRSVGGGVLITIGTGLARLLLFSLVSNTCPVLLVSAGLFLKTLHRATSADPGFDPRNVLVAGVDLSPNGYDAGRGQVARAVRRIDSNLHRPTGRYIVIRLHGNSQIK